MYCSFDYAPAKENIAAPPLGLPVDDEVYGFNDIEQHKFDWKGRIVRLEVTPKILESKQIGEDTYRGFFKDTATPSHYGVVEFPHDAWVKLGFLKRILSEFGTRLLPARSPLPVAALPSMSLIPSAPFTKVH
jgi:hypothetical protein